MSIMWIVMAFLIMPLLKNRSIDMCHPSIDLRQSPNSQTTHSYALIHIHGIDFTLSGMSLGASAKSAGDEQLSPPDRGR